MTSNTSTGRVTIHKVRIYYGQKNIVILEIGMEYEIFN